jgi:hypothetical protein
MVGLSNGDGVRWGFMIMLRGWAQAFGVLNDAIGTP